MTIHWQKRWVSCRFSLPSTNPLMVVSFLHFWAVFLVTPFLYLKASKMATLRSSTTSISALKRPVFEWWFYQQFLLLRIYPWFAGRMVPSEWSSPMFASSNLLNFRQKLGKIAIEMDVPWDVPWAHLCRSSGWGSMMPLELPERQERQDRQVSGGGELLPGPDNPGQWWKWITPAWKLMLLVDCPLSLYIYITMVGKMSHLTFRGMLLKVFIGKNKHGVFPPSWMVQTGWLGGGWHFDLLTHWNSWSCWKRSTAELELMNLRTTSWCQLNVAHSAAGLWSFSVPFFAHGKRSFLRLLPALQRSQGGSERGESLGDWAAAGSSTVVWADGSQWWRLHFSGRVRLDGPPANQGALWISDLLSPWVLISCKSIISGMGQSLWNWGITIHSPAKL